MSVSRNKACLTHADERLLFRRYEALEGLSCGGGGKGDGEQAMLRKAR